MKTALLISTYNWTEALELVLDSVANQSMPPDEVLIADDGSTHDTKSIIENYAATATPQIKHIWHKDDGFRRSVILNKAIAASTADYIVQVDGDCILHPDFIRDHVNFARANQFLYGSRVNIKESHLADLFTHKNVRFSAFSKGIKKRTRALRLPLLARFYRANDQLSKKLRGCNLSFYRSDFINVNGYNEQMTGWGKEDSEFVARLLHNGLTGKRLRYAGIIYHIWHRVKPKSRLNINESIQQETIDRHKKVCELGIDQYLN
jgi:glycosyltransferase involved in cell wall biosynthesis